MDLRAKKIRKRYGMLEVCSLKTCNRWCFGPNGTGPEFLWEFGNSETGRRFAVCFCSLECRDEVKDHLMADGGVRFITATGDVILERKGAAVGGRA